MSPGALGIPVPQNTEVVIPAAALVPLVGFDDKGYRLGYGGGYFDRTLAAMAVKPITVGVGFELARLPTIHPQPHDIPMDVIVTEAGVHMADRERLERVDPPHALPLPSSDWRLRAGFGKRVAVVGAEHVFLHLAHCIARQMLDEKHALGNLEVGDVRIGSAITRDSVSEWSDRGTTTATTASPRSESGTPIDGALRHTLDRIDPVLDFLRVDVEPAADDQVLCPADDSNVVLGGPAREASWWRWSASSSCCTSEAPWWRS